jgi:hypothetical protein
MIKVATAYSQSQKARNRLTFVEGAVEDNGLIQDLGAFDLIYSHFPCTTGKYRKRPCKTFMVL